MSKKRIKFLNSKNPLVKFGLGVLKGSTVTVISVIATFGIVIAISTFVHAGSLTPPGAPASTGIRSGPNAMSAEGGSGGSYTYTTAATYCYGLSAAAAVARDGNTTTVYTDWRLPSAPEAAVFEGTITSANQIWTSTAYTCSNSWVVMKLSTGDWTGNYTTGYCGLTQVQIPTAYVRCVR